MAELYEKIYVFCFSSELKHQIERVLSKYYIIDFIQNKDELFSLIETSGKPVAVFAEVSNHYTTGFEILAELKEECPDASRILLTDIREPKELIPILKDTAALMYVKYPCTNFDLFQTAVLGAKFADLKRKFNANQLVSSGDTKQLLTQMEQIDKENKELRYSAENLGKANTILQNEIADLSNLVAGKANIIDNLGKENTDLKHQIEAITKEQASERNLYSDADSKIESLENTISKLEFEIEETRRRVFDYDSLLALSTYVREFNKFSFIDHTYYVSSLAKDIGAKMNLDNDRLHNLLTAALLHNISILNMPNYFQVANPNDMAPERRKHYFYYFGRALRILKKAKPLSRSVEIIEQIWEHADGTGFPHGTPGMRISDEAQILAIANLYVKNVYSLNEKEFTNLMKEKKVQQSPETTVKKHKAAIDLIRRNSYWFRKSVSDVFLSLADKMESNAFTAPSRALIIDIQELISADNQKTKNEFIEIDFYDKDLMLDWETAEGHKVYVKSKEINIPDLKHGMILSKDLTSDGGAIVVKANTEIKEAEFKNIWQMISKDMLHGTTEIYIPFEH